MYASQKGHKELALWFLQHGATLEDLLERAPVTRDMDFVRLLIERGGRCNVRCLCSAASPASTIEILRFALKYRCRTVIVKDVLKSAVEQNFPLQSLQILREFVKAKR